MWPVAIACSDIHLSETAPWARSGEKDWYAAMEKPLAELRGLSKRLNVPVLCAGDIFDKWKASPELINFALDALPAGMYCIPGQHDLPLHNIFDLHKSALWTLVKVKKVKLVPKETRYVMGLGYHPDMLLYGYSWGVPVTRPAPSKLLRIALVHAYESEPGKEHPGAKPSNFKKTYAGFDTVIIGDNHVPVDARFNGTTIFGCGGFMRRKTDDKHRPRVGIIMQDGSVQPHYLDTTGESFNTEPAGPAPSVQEYGPFISKLQNLNKQDLDYPGRLREKARSAPSEVRLLLEKALDAPSRETSPH